MRSVCRKDWGLEPSTSVTERSLRASPSSGCGATLHLPARSRKREPHQAVLDHPTLACRSLSTTTFCPTFFPPYILERLHLSHPDRSAGSLNGTEENGKIAGYECGHVNTPAFGQGSESFEGQYREGFPLRALRPHVAPADLTTQLSCCCAKTLDWILTCQGRSAYVSHPCPTLQWALSTNSNGISKRRWK